MSVRGHQLAIDWSGQGTFTGTVEDVSSYVLDGEMAISVGRDITSAKLEATAGSIEFNLRNDSRIFSPENSGSPLAGQILPGRTVRYQQTSPVTGGTLLSEPWGVAGNLQGWQAPDGGTLTRVASPSEDGNGGLQFVPPGAVATLNVNRATRLNLQHSTAPVTISFRVRSSAGWSDVVAAVDWHDAAGTYLSTGGLGAPVACAAGTWTTVMSAPLTPPAGAASIRPRLRLGSTPPATNTFNVDSTLITFMPAGVGATRTLMQGPIDGFSVSATDPARTFAVSALDAWGIPGQQKLSTELHRGLRTGDAIHLVLDAIGWTGGRDIDPGVTLIPWWWEEDTDAATAINRLVNSEGPPAIAFVEGGTFVFHDRHHRLTRARSKTSQALFTHLEPVVPLAGDFKIEDGDLTYDHGVQNIINSATFSVAVRAAQQRAVVWTSDDPITLYAGQTIEVQAQASDPFYNADTPVRGVDYVLDYGSIAVDLDRTSGQSVTMTVTCSVDSVITKLSLRANPVTVVRTVKVGHRDQASINTFQLQEWGEEAPWADRYTAEAIAQRIVAVYANYRPTLTFTVYGLNAEYIAKFLDTRISDRVTVRVDPLGVNGDFIVERYTHRSTNLGVEQRLVLEVQAVEPTQPANVFTFDDPTRGFNNGAFGVAGIDSAANMFTFDDPARGFNSGVFGT